MNGRLPPWIIVVLLAALLLMFVAKETLVKRPRPTASPGGPG